MKPNYKNKKRKPTRIVDKKRFTLAMLLAASISFGVGHKLFNDFKEAKEYNGELKQYYSMLNDNTHRTNDNQNNFIDTWELAEDIKKINIESKDEFYHILASVGCQLWGDVDKNFENLIKDLNLNKLAQTNSNYPTEQQLYAFLRVNNLLKTNGNINFNAWMQYDKEVFILENEIEEIKNANNEEEEGKIL